MIAFVAEVKGRSIERPLHCRDKGISSAAPVAAGFAQDDMLPSYFAGGRLAGGMIPFMRRYSTICP